MNTLAEQMLTRRVLEQFQVTITQSDQTSYLLNTSSDLDNSLNHTVPINLPSLDWSLTLTPSRQWVEGQRSSWPTMTFTSLLLMGLLTSLTTLLVQLILKRNQALLNTRKELEQEIDQRVAKQVDLDREALNSH